MLGQFDRTQGGEMYLVEDEVSGRFGGPQSGALSFVTQTTLSVDDTAKVIDALRQRFPL